MARTRTQLDADRHAAVLRQRLAEDCRRLREDAGVTRAAIARLAGLDPKVIARVEDGTIRFTEQPPCGNLPPLGLQIGGAG